MDEKSLSDLLVNILPDEIEKAVNQGGEHSAQEDVLAGLLKASARQFGAPTEQAVDEFLVGKGELYETTRSALVRGKGTAKSDITEFLTSKLNIPAPVANIIAGMLLNLVGSISTDSETETPAKKKPRKKKKPASGSTAKPAPASSKKKAKKKTTTKPKKPVKKTTSKSEKPAAKPTTKKKPTAKTTKKESTSKKQPDKAATKSTSVEG